MVVDSRDVELVGTAAVAAGLDGFALASNRLLVAAAHRGDQDAWEELVDRYSGLIEAVARKHRLGADDVGDVSQIVWLALLSNLGRLKDPERVGLWLHTTARRECLAAIRRSERDRPSWARSEDLVDELSSPAETVLRAERAQQVRLALEMMQEQCRVLLEMLLVREPPAHYAEISDHLSIAVGTIGPRRRRCLDKLRRFYCEIDGSARRVS